jgi:hypothetical protein
MSIKSPASHQRHKSCVESQTLLAQLRRRTKIHSSESTRFASRFGCIARGGNETSRRGKETICLPASATK